ncbi:MAG TPA: hypothetical protein VN457_02820 [Chlamydiales bacterium]|nr:hypothetical protein [Chlamydiales bacterium]
MATQNVQAVSATPIFIDDTAAQNSLPSIRGTTVTEISQPKEDHAASYNSTYAVSVQIFSTVTSGSAIFVDAGSGHCRKLTLKK